MFTGSMAAAYERRILRAQAGPYDARDLSFGKDADDIAVAYRVASFAQGVNHVTWTKLRGNRNCANQFGEGLDVRLFVDVLEDQEADRTVHGGEKQQRIN